MFHLAERRPSKLRSSWHNTVFPTSHASSHLTEQMRPCQALGWMLGTQRSITQTLCPAAMAHLQSAALRIHRPHTKPGETRRSVTVPIFLMDKLNIQWIILSQVMAWKRLDSNPGFSDSLSRALSAGEFLYCQLKSSKLLIFPPAPGFYLAAQCGKCVPLIIK